MNSTRGNKKKHGFFYDDDDDDDDEHFNYNKKRGDRPVTQQTAGILPGNRCLPYTLFRVPILIITTNTCVAMGRDRQKLNLGAPDEIGPNQREARAA